MAARNKDFSDPVLAEIDFSLGMKRDMPRNTIPQGGVYDASDFMLDRAGYAWKRGGTQYPGTGAAMGTAHMQAVGIDLSGFPISLSSAGALYNANTASAITATAFNCQDKPKHRVNGASSLLIFPNSDGSTAPTAYNENLGDADVLGGSPPGGKYCELYKSHLLLGGSGDEPQRIYLSPIPDITTTWDTTDNWLDASHGITGLASLSNAVLIFSKGSTEKLTGSFPPNSSSFDMRIDPLAAVGCADARSITVADNNCFFASPSGVYLTNGVAYISLTREGGIDSYWRSLFLNMTTPAITTALYAQSYLFVTAMDAAASTPTVTTLICNVSRRAWWRLTNFNAVMYASSTFLGVEELYYADRFLPHVFTVSSIFNPLAAYKNDADGTAVQPTIEFRGLGQGTGIKSFGFGRLTYDMRDAATDNPTLAVTVKTGVKASATTTVAESPLVETTDVTRKRFTIAKDSQVLSVKVAQTNASSLTEVYGLEVDSRPYPVSEDGVS